MAAATIDRAGTRIVAASVDGEVFLLACPSFEELGHGAVEGGATFLAAAPDGSGYVLAGPARFEFRSAVSFEPLVSVSLPSPARSLAVSEDGRWVAIGRDDGIVEVRNRTAFRIAARQRISDQPVTAVSLNSVAGLLAAGTYDGKFGVYRLPGSLE